MPFNSLAFLLLFLPSALALHAACLRWAPSRRGAFLVALSFAFYGWWDPRFVPLLAVSVLANWALARAWLRTRADALLVLAVVLDLGLLALVKYLDFLVGLLGLADLLALPPVGLALPLGISFFTFQHVMYLVDLRRGATRPMPLTDYALYVAFFPRVIAGPLVRPAAFLETVTAPLALLGQAPQAILLLVLGLVKKVMIGDGLAPFVDPVFAAAAAGRSPGLAEAWQAMLGYTFQLYFDFSGYTDMALGIAFLFGIRLPENFDAPYRAASIQDFWRRWHMTLSFFLRDYLYISMGGSRHGLPRQLGALFATMALGGLWHGAGLTFVAWGAVHGVALGLHVLWRRAGLALPPALGLAATFLFVALAWVLFRAPNFAAAAQIYRGLVGLGAGQGTADPSAWPFLAVAAALAAIGPTAFALSRRLPATPWVAAAAALVLALVLLKVGDDANHAFIYARF